MKILPFDDRVLILPAKKDDVSSFGFLLSAVSEDRAQSGKIVAIADNLKTEKVGQIDVGDNVVFNKYAGCEIEIDEVKYVIINFCDLIGKIEEE